MAAHDHQVIMAAYLTLGSAALTLDGVQATLTTSVEFDEDTVWGDLWKQRKISLGDVQLTFEAINDYTDNELDEDLDALIRTEIACALRPDSGAISATNPEYQFTGAVSTLQKTFQHGKVPRVSGTVMLTSGSGITRDVTP